MNTDDADQTCRALICVHLRSYVASHSQLRYDASLTRRLAMRRLFIPAIALLLPTLAATQPRPPSVAPLVRVVDLNVGDTVEVELANNKKVKVKLVDLQETSDPIRNAIRLARVKVEIDGQPASLES